jgi:hypothetical protein
MRDDMRLRSGPADRKRGRSRGVGCQACDAFDGRLSCSLRKVRAMERMLLLWDDLDDTFGIVRHVLGNALHGLFRPR